jgi:hypothetical protein
MKTDPWREPPNSNERIRKFNHHEGRYAVWGRTEGGRERWDVMDGQGGDRDEGKPVSGPFASREEAIREAERIIEQNRRSTRGTGVKT